MTENKEQQGIWLKVFCPEARCLSPEEVASLPGDKRQAAQETGKDGLRLEVFCPDQSCLPESEKVMVARPASPDQPPGKAGFWLSLFCPEDQCQIGAGGDLA